MKDYLLPALLVLAAMTFVGIRIARRMPASETLPTIASAPTGEPAAGASPAPVSPTKPDIDAASPEAAPSTSVLPPTPFPGASAKPVAPTKSAQPAKPAKPPKIHIPDSPPVQAARAALASVGEDPAAEAIWMDTINDPATPAEARNDLIEDLNQDGFDDPKHLTPDDLPLIESRIALVELLGPAAMDDTNSAAFQEAYKDLLNMESKLVGPIP